MKILFVCSGNIRRSRTAHDIYRKNPVDEFELCGTHREWIRENIEGEAQGAVEISLQLVAWADRILCMQEEHREFIDYHYGQRYTEKCEVLDVPDYWERGHEELVEILKSKIQL